MTESEITRSGNYLSSPYIKECACGTFNKVFTQQDEDPEYYTELWVKCRNKACEEYIMFCLPVN